jgi:hypothetical protein
MDMVNGPNAVKSEWIKLDFLMDPDNPSSKYSWPFAIFKEWIKWEKMALREIEILMPLKELPDKITKYSRQFNMNISLMEYLEKLKWNQLFSN